MSFDRMILTQHLVLAFLLVYAVGRGFETFRKRAQLPGRIVEPYSLPLIVVAYVAFYLSLLWTMFDVNFRMPDQRFVVVGIMMVLMSIAGRHWAIKNLGMFHSIHIEIRDQHELITSGPYQYVRNPYYLSNAIEALGFIFTVNFSPVVMIIAAPYLLLLCHRLLIEEQALQNKFAETFSAYKSSVPRLIPRLYGVGKILFDAKLLCSRSKIKSCR